ncbi:hypothetical protein ULVI_12680 [Cochleicola gelatinilyticus]|uniref:Uncharacterized protein n=2 Tax=Cochleicola gelatinilyticus TaxID=1763537 RepID=A0A167G9A3_9FLAO|nr:hypothetical protein ULVI_12680 [Cochleicola gelatinilyticus]
MIEDSGNAPTIYGYDIQKKLVAQTITITNAKNTDWEDLASDLDGNLYIGDFGNNHNKRNDLSIYKVERVGSISEKETEATKTSFSFEDQVQFPPKKKNRNFDVEGFIFLNDYFYLFTRNRSKHFDGTTSVYRLPAKEGSFKAKRIASYITCTQKQECAVTSADYDLETNTLVLLSYSNVWAFSNFENDRFFEGTVKHIPLQYPSQKESISFKNSDTVFIVDELTNIVGGNLYEMKLNN